MTNQKKNLKVDGFTTLPMILNILFDYSSVIITLR